MFLICIESSGVILEVLSRQVDSGGSKSGHGALELWPGD